MEPVEKKPKAAKKPRAPKAKADAGAGGGEEKPKGASPHSPTALRLIFLLTGSPQLPRAAPKKFPKRVCAANF